MTHPEDASSGRPGTWRHPTPPGEWLTCAPEQLPNVTVRWEDPAQQEIFVVESEAYRCRIATFPARILSLEIHGRDVLQTAGMAFGFVDDRGVRYAPAPREITPGWMTWQKDSYKPAHNARARMNVWHASPYYWDAHLLDIPLMREGADSPEAPIRGEVVFHAFPDQLRIELRAEPPEGTSLDHVLLTSPALRGEVAAHEGRPILVVKSGDITAGFLGPDGSSFDAENNRLVAPGETGRPAETGRPGIYWVFRPAEAGRPVRDVFVEDLYPLPAEAFGVQDGHALGYDAASGLYPIHVPAHQTAFGFEAAYKNPDRRMATGITVSNDTYPRRVVVKCVTGVGGLEAAVVADRYGFPLPVPAFVCKNFAGEKEEPDDTAFGDSYFPLFLNAGDERSFQVFHLIQDWGNHPLKQISSIRFWHIFWHLSTGASETTCFTQNWMRTHNDKSIFHIPDFRPMSGEMWPAQPQHHCEQWPGFLQYNEAPVHLIYERTVFESISPCLARFTMSYHTSDDAVTARVHVMEMPQRDEMRTFVRLRYDWHHAVDIEGDARLNFRWLNINEKEGADLVLWMDPEEEIRTARVTEGKPMLTGEPLPERFAVVGTHQTKDRKRIHALVLVRHFHARLGGRDYRQPALSAEFQTSIGDYWLTVPNEMLALKPGDFLEADIMLMPHGEPVPHDVKPLRERKRFGMDGPTVAEVTVGQKLADFPATVRAEKDAALFTLAGGFDNMPVIVEGFTRRGVPLLWRDNDWQDQQVHGGDGYQVEPDGSGGYRFVFVYPTRTGQRHRLMVTRAECTADIACVRDSNGLPVLEGVGQGTFSLKAPVLFGPGHNEMTAGSPVIGFHGAAARVRALPLAVSVSQDRVTVDVNEEGTQVTTQGAPATITFSQLAPGAVYTVIVNDEQTRQTAANGFLEVETTAPETTIRIEKSEVTDPE